MNIDDCKNYEELGLLMLDSLKKIKENNPDKKLIQVCGPITTGGLSSIEQNMNRIKEVIVDFESKGYIAFDQTPFEDKMFEIKAKRKQEKLFEHYDWDLLHGCYIPIFSSGFFDHLVFLPGYESSIGARWEYDMALKYGIDTICLSE